MAKATKRNASAVCRLYIDNPGEIRCQMTAGGEHVYSWHGGEIAAIADVNVAPVVFLANGGSLPWELDWIEHDDANERWYVRRKAKDGKDE